MIVSASAASAVRTALDRSMTARVSSASISSCDRILLTAAPPDRRRPPRRHAPASSPDLGQPHRFPQARPQPRQRQRPQLRDARLADADHLADFRQRQLFFVVERQDLPLAVGQLGERPRQVLAQLLPLQPRLGPLAGIDAELDERRAVGRRRVELPQGPDFERANLLERLLVVRLRQPHGRRDLPFGRLAAQFVAQPGDGAVELAPQLAQRARRPVEIAQRVEHGALYPPARERVERHAGRRLVAARRVDEAQHADADEIGDLDLRRQPLSQPLGHRLHEAHVADHEPVALLQAGPRTGHAHCDTSASGDAASGYRPAARGAGPPRRRAARAPPSARPARGSTGSPATAAGDRRSAAAPAPTRARPRRVE